MARASETALVQSTFPAWIAVLAANVHAASDTIVPIRLVGTEAPVIQVRVQGKDLPLQLDLGDASSLVIHPEVLATLRSEPTGKTFKFFSMDGQFETPIVSLEDVEIGVEAGVDLPPFPAAFPGVGCCGSAGRNGEGARRISEI